MNSILKILKEKYRVIWWGGSGSVGLGHLSNFELADFMLLQGEEESRRDWSLGMVGIAHPSF